MQEPVPSCNYRVTTCSFGCRGNQVVGVLPVGFWVAILEPPSQLLFWKPTDTVGHDLLLLLLRLLLLVLLPLLLGILLLMLLLMFLRLLRLLGLLLLRLVRLLLGIQILGLLLGIQILGFLLLIIPGIYFTFWYMLSHQVTVIERLSGFAAMKRSKQLVKGSLNQAFLILFVLGVFGFLLGAGASIIPDLNIGVVVSSVLQLALQLVTLAALVVFYFSCRCKVENYDLEHLATEMAGRDGDLPSDGEPPRDA